MKRQKKSFRDYQCLCPKNSFRVRKTQSLGEMLLGEYCEDIDECADGKCRGDHRGSKLIARLFEGFRYLPLFRSGQFLVYKYDILQRSNT